jgi:hypothetical protein
MARCQAGPFPVKGEPISACPFRAASWVRPPGSGWPGMVAYRVTGDSSLAAPDRPGVLVPRLPLPALALAGAALACLGPVAARSSAGEGGFIGRETRELVEICAVRPGGARHPEARAFCHGYLTGAYSTLLADRPAGAPPLHCNLPAGRQEPIDRFVAWAQTRPDQLRAFPPNAFLRFMDETYACPGR